jgi:hypothetical protein
MADGKISDDATVTPADADFIPVIQGGANKKATVASIAARSTANGAQASDATLTALAAYNTNGLLTQTAADTFTGRTLAGTSNRLTVTNGDGVAGAPTFDISSSYVGQASITTLGTIGTGVWQGTLIASTSGGTGVNNAGTLTNATNTTITGGGTLALGGFTLTVPATGSAALLATANTFTLAQTAQRDFIAATSTDGLILTNATAAAAGAQQWSPRLRLTGQGWKTNATAASQTVDWIVENRPVQSAASPSTTLVIASQINGGGFVDLVTFAPLAFGITFAAGLLASANNTHNLGSSGARWKDAFFGGTLTGRVAVFQSTVVGDFPLIAKGVSGQTANLQEWQDSTAGILSTISENGYFTTRKIAAPADAELAASEMALWFDSSNGAAKLMIKGKTVDGTVVTGNVALA